MAKKKKKRIEKIKQKVRVKKKGRKFEVLVEPGKQAKKKKKSSK